MARFVDKDKPKTRSSTDIIRDIYEVARKHNTTPILNFIKQKPEIFDSREFNSIYEKDAHIFEELHPIGRQAEQAIRLTDKKYYLDTLDLINYIEEQPTANIVWSSEQNILPLQNKEFFGIVLFREYIEKSFTNGQLPEEERKKGHEIANEFQTSIDIIKKLGAELTVALNQQQSGVSF